MHAVITKRNKPVTTTRWTGKWSNGLPAPNTNAYIDTDYTTATGSFACRDLILTASAVLTIPENTYVKILKDINQTATSHIIVKAGGELMLLNVDADVTTARLTAEATYKNLQRLDYAFISSPISGIPVKRLSPGTLDNRFYEYNEETNQFNTVNPTTKSTLSGEGFHIRTPANHPDTATNFNISINNFTGGTINKGIINIPVIYGKSGFNLVGNPYHSRLSLRKFYEANKNNLSSTLHIWRKTNGAQGHSYMTYNYYVNNIENSDLNVLPFQAFVIQVNKNSLSNIVFTPDMIIPYKKHSITDKIYINLFQKNINLPIGGISYNIKDHNSSFENKRIEGNTLSIIKDSDMQIYEDILWDISNVIKLKLNVNILSEYTLNLKDISGIILSLHDINLYDALMGTTHNLKNSDYTFTSEAGTFDNRFSITFQ